MFHAHFTGQQVNVLHAQPASKSTKSDIEAVHTWTHSIVTLIQQMFQAWKSFYGSPIEVQDQWVNVFLH